MACQAHKVHRPANLTTELHHVIPVGWQQHTTLAPGVAPPFPGVDQAGRGQLWDARTVELCPTGHRNVHAWIVRMTRALAAAQSDDPLVAYKAVRPRLLVPVEFGIAYDALTRLRVYGSLLALTKIGEWGQA